MYVYVCIFMQTFPLSINGRYVWIFCKPHRMIVDIQQFLFFFFFFVCLVFYVIRSFTCLTSQHLLCFYGAAM